MKWYERFYRKEKWIKKSVEIEGKLYDRLNEISKNELEASVNKIIDACISDLKLENRIVIYCRDKNEINVARSIILRESNYKKLEELREKYGIGISKIVNIAIKLGLELISLKDINCNIEVEEDQQTFEDNSKKKAKEISIKTNMPCIADDTGLCIDVFNGWPGIYTNRFLGENATQEQKNRAILEKMKNLEGEQRNAKFECVVTYYENGEFIVAKGEVKGKIAKQPRGENGFGVDPIFELENGKTYAELTKEEKNEVSHRKKALENLKNQLTYKEKYDKINNCNPLSQGT